jgi:hypothetical protein
MRAQAPLVDMTGGNQSVFGADVSMRAQAPLVDMTGGFTKKRDEVGGKAANLILPIIT